MVRSAGVGRSPSAPVGRPLVIAVAAVLALLEGIALAAYSGYVIVQVARLGITGPTEVSNVPAVVLEIVIFAAFGAGLIAAAWGLWRCRRWARAPIVLGQLIAIVVGLPLATAAGSVERAAGIALVAAAVIAGAAVVSPPATRALMEADGA